MSPASRGSTPNYAASGQGILNSDAFNVRIDRYQTEKLHMFGRYSFMQVRIRLRRARSATRRAARTSRRRRSRAARRCATRASSYGVDYVIRPNWLADFRFGFFRYRVFVNPNGLGTSPAKDAGIPGLNLDNYYTSGMPRLHAQRHRRLQLRLLAGHQPVQLPAQRAGERIPMGRQHDPHFRQPLAQVRRRLALSSRTCACRAIRTAPAS